MAFTRRLFMAATVTASLALAACGGGDGGSAGGGRGIYEREGDRALGSADAPVTLIEYSSVACPHCADFHKDVWPMIEEEYVETGQVRFVLREMLTGDPNFAAAGFLLARCVPEERYFDAVEVLFAQQSAIFRAARVPNGARNQYLSIANAFGLSEAEFNACQADREQIAALNAANEQALEDGVTGTPRFIINGGMLESIRPAGSSEFVYAWRGREVLIDGERVPALVDEDTFRRLMDHFIAQEGAGESATEG